MGSGYTRYLESKKTVDERARNQTVWKAFLDAISQSNASESLRFIELGAGTGSTMLQVIEKCHKPLIQYYVVDSEPDHLAALATKLKLWAATHQYDYYEGSPVVLQNSGQAVEFYIWEADIHAFLASNPAGKGDFLIGQAVLDLFDIDQIMPELTGSVTEGGYMYFPITFDGMSTFVPGFDRSADELVERIYHESMGADRGAMRSQTGRQLLVKLIQAGVEIVSAGSSDWVVIPDASRQYPHDEKYFINHILECVEKEIMRSTAIDHALGRRWVDFRKKQLDQGLLIYIAHQLDILARTPGAKTSSTSI